MNECRYLDGAVGRLLDPSETQPVLCEDARTIHVRVYPSANELWCVSIQRVSDRLVIEGRYHDVVSRADSIIRAMEPGCY